MVIWNEVITCIYLCNFVLFSGIYLIEPVLRTETTGVILRIVRWLLISKNFIVIIVKLQFN